MQRQCISHCFPNSRLLLQAWSLTFCIMFTMNAIKVTLMGFSSSGLSYRKTTSTHGGGIKRGLMNLGCNLQYLVLPLLVVKFFKDNSSVKAVWCSAAWRWSCRWSPRPGRWTWPCCAQLCAEKLNSCPIIIRIRRCSSSSCNVHVLINWCRSHLQEVIVARNTV